MKFNEPRWTAKLDEAFWPIVYILTILIIALLADTAKAQDKVTVDRWRLEKACRELILLDSLVKDYAMKDSAIVEYKSAITSLESEVSNWKHVGAERKIQIDNLYALNDTYANEVSIWKKEARRQKRLKIGGFALSGAIIIGILLLK